MRRRFALVVCLFAVPLFLTQLTKASGLIQVVEDKTSVSLSVGGSSVTLTVNNASGKAVDARVQIEILEPDNDVCDSIDEVRTLQKGTTTTTLIFADPPNRSRFDSSELLWYRLRYRVTPINADNQPPSSGIISFSEILPTIFDIRVAAPSAVQEGKLVRVRAQAVQPITARPVDKVEITGTISYDTADGKSKVAAKSITNRDGFATLDFHLPSSVNSDDDLDVSVTATGGVQQLEVSGRIQLDKKTLAMLTTDKPLYQPGQTLHTRALLFDSAKRAIPDHELELKVEDPDGNVVFHAKVTTSRFGVASADWNIPDSTRLGTYTISLSSDDETISSSEAKISRYDLPNFAVTVKPDRSYYLPGQNAEISVRADYLFGEPVKRARVRVVREQDRRWNYEEQKYEVKETEVYQGEFDDKSQYTTHIGLNEDHRELSDEDYSRFKDITYAAYVTDPTSNRTEQRRFDLRVTRDAIHVYVVEADYQQSADLPLAFYVSASYADGSPAECSVTITGNADRSSTAAEANASSGRFLMKVRTNRYGVAKVEGVLAARDADEPNSIRLNFLANDGKGSTGQQADSLWLGDKKILRVRTDKSIYRQGEPVRVMLTGNVPDGGAFVDIVRENQVLRSYAVTLRNGSAGIVVPNEKQFVDDLTIVAYTALPHESDEVVSGNRTVVFPRDNELKLKVDMSQPEYRPGQEAHASLVARGADGNYAESALGIVVLDRAVEERFRTENDFGGANGFYDAYAYLSGYNAGVGGLSRRDLNKLDLTKPVPADLELAAEVMLRTSGERYIPRVFGSYAGNDLAYVFSSPIKSSLNPLRSWLNWRYLLTGEYPKDERQWTTLAGIGHLDLSAANDPWGLPYRTLYSTERVNSVMQFQSAGPDKRFGTGDDFVAQRLSRPYFLPYSYKFTAAINEYHKRTGAYVRDDKTLRQALANEGVALDSLRDPWGQPYAARFSVDGRRFVVSAISGGPNKRIEQDKNSYRSDDITLWTGQIDYFSEAEPAIGGALFSYGNAAKRFPADNAEFERAMIDGNVNWRDIRDPWGRPYTPTFQVTSRYADRVKVINQNQYGTNKATQKTEVTPVTQQLRLIRIRSSGQDGVAGNSDDFDVAQFSFVESEQGANDAMPTPQPVSMTTFTGATGAISGTVFDPAGAVISAAKVKAINRNSFSETTTQTDSEGNYLLRNLVAGLYDVSIEAPGFKNTLFTDVPVRSSSLTQLNATLNVGGVSEAVTITAEAAIVETSSSQVSSSSATVNKSLQRRSGSPVVLRETATPRLRQYFPETLVWQPSLETDKRGRAKFDFKMADNITTWKMSVIGSTTDGRLGMVEKDIRSFQPFFVDHDPPRVLTEGDEISLPVVLRNYLDQPQTVQLDIKPEGWFSLLEPATKRSQVPAGDAKRETFDLRAIASVKDGKQRLTAVGGDASDAIEKPVTVHPDGEDAVSTASQVFRNDATLELEIPAAALAGGRHAELKIYPNLLAHISEGIEGILQRPHGCGEQTISSTYPNLIALRYLKETGADSPVATKARKYLQEGYERLLNYRTADGGFSYWGGASEPDQALTAYALRFLSDARALIVVDSQVINASREWLLKRQQPDGTWSAKHQWEKQEDRRSNTLLTAYIGRVLAMTEEWPDSKNGSNSDSQQTGSAKPVNYIATDKSSPTRMAIRSALAVIDARADELDEPFLIASYALAAFNAQDAPRGRIAAARLKKLVHSESGANYWLLETNTPFYGWGMAGRIETTALALQALIRDGELEEDAALRQINEDMINRGLLFLLRNKDRYGVWYSTQATVNVFDTLTAIASRKPAKDGEVSQGESGTAEVFVNGSHAATLQMPQSTGFANPIFWDATEVLRNGANRIEVRRTGTAPPASVQAVANYYLPWPNSTARSTTNTRTGDSSALRLGVSFDKTNAKITDEITCHVEAERIGFQGYGMLLAEIGLPPGADVDRASMESAMKAAGWDINHYDILPDKMILYLWPRAGGTKFDFKFRSRFALKALSAPSTLYDYYNPDARTAVVPTKFVIR